jgi:hypothetical protein
MPAKVDVGRRCADVLAGLAATGNVRLTLKRCGISHYWAYRQRGRDPDFRARWDTAMRNGKRALAAAARARADDPGAPAVQAGLMLVGSAGKDTLRLEGEKPCSFTPAKRATFLAALRATCNVRAAAQAAGVSATGAYARFHADAGLREDWTAALAEGRVHLEMAALAAARALFEGGAATEPAATPAVTGMDAKTALQLLRLHDPRRADGRARFKWAKAADPEATRAAILAKVAAVKAARGQAG